MPSVNDERTVALLTSLRPVLVVVNGTRIIATRVLESAGCPVVNLHAGITPRYRGVHGGYWALAEHHPEWVGTTVHLVDPGIDTGGVLAQSVFDVTGEDSFATYPYLHLVHGLPLLGDQVDKVMAGAPSSRTRPAWPPARASTTIRLSGATFGAGGARGCGEHGAGDRTSSDTVREWMRR